MLSTSSSTITIDCRNTGRRNMIELPDQEAHKLADELADLDEDEQDEDREHRGERVVPERHPRHPVEIAYLVLPDVEVHDHQDLADDGDRDECDPCPWWRVRAGLFGLHVAHQPDGDDADAVADRAGCTADQALEQGAARQQRRRQREPQEHQTEGGAGERIASNPPAGLLFRWFPLRSRFFRRPSAVSVTKADYRCVKSGGRFSVKASMPSVWSAVANAEWNSLRS